MKRYTEWCNAKRKRRTNGVVASVHSVQKREGGNNEKKGRAGRGGAR